MRFWTKVTGSSIQDFHLGSRSADSDFRLRHGRRVDVELYRRIAPAQQVGLKARRHVEHECVGADIHRSIDDGTIDGIGQTEIRLEQPIMNACRERGPVGIDDCDRCIGDIGLDPRGLAADAERERIDDKCGEDFVTPSVCHRARPAARDNFGTGPRSQGI
jgi:hypothetical protein